MPLDPHKCYSLVCIASKKLRDGWAKDERKIDGYRVKKMQRNSRRETVRWTEKQTESEDRDRVRARDRKKRWREFKKPQQKPKAH